MTELQSFGLRLDDPTSPNSGVASRRGGAGPSDHKAVIVDGHTIMVPVHTSTAWRSPFVAQAPDAQGRSALTRGAIPIANISFPKAPRFYECETTDGIPYSHIATLHGSDVLATNCYGQGALGDSSFCGHVAVVRVLTDLRTVDART